MADDYTPPTTEAEWKTLATTEITHLTDEEKDYLPRAWDEWIARVKRDAARAALDGLAVTYRDVSTLGILQYRDTHYPEETP